jgi:Secretion system C-terminal sorting domain
MKKFFMLSLLAISSFYSSGQSIVVSTNLWSNIMALEPSGQLFTEKIKFTTDTTINLLTYKVVKRTLDKNQLTWYSYGFIREDANKRVYYKLNASDPEKLLYDLNLALNDSILAFGVNTFNNTVFLDSAMYHVTAVDSLLIGNSYRRQLHLSGNIGGSMMEATQWIDSMGGMNGILHNWNLKVGEDGYGLLCFEENGILEYHNPYYTVCYVSTGIESLNSQVVVISVNPNPVMDISTIRINGMNKNSDFLVRFYNSFGENVLIKEVSNEFLLRRSEIPPGIYLLTVQSTEGIVASGKIVIR